MLFEVVAEGKRSGVALLFMFFDCTMDLLDDERGNRAGTDAETESSGRIGTMGGEQSVADGSRDIGGFEDFSSDNGSSDSDNTGVCPLCRVDTREEREVDTRRLVLLEEALALPRFPCDLRRILADKLASRRAVFAAWAAYFAASCSAK